MIVVGFDWDKWNWPKCGKHGATKTEIEFVLEHTTFRARDPFMEEERFNTAHMAMTGRHIFVVFTYRDKNDGRYIRPVSARPLHDKEVRKYEQIRQKLAKSAKP